MVSLDPHDRNQQNRLLILHFLRKHRITTIENIQRETHLTLSTVNSIIEALVRERLTTVEGVDPLLSQKPFLPSNYVKFDVEAKHVIGIDIGRSSLNIVSTNLDGDLENSTTPHSFNTDAGATTCLLQVSTYLREFLDNYHLIWDDILGIGVGIPGTFDQDTQQLINPPRMPNWGGININRTLAQNLQTHVPIYIDNDANMGALGENRFGAGARTKNMIYVKISTGIGSGLILNDQIYHGVGGYAGEIGHVIVRANGPQCACGQKGCLEAIAGREAIIQDACQGISLKHVDIEAYHKGNFQLAGKADYTIEEVIQAAKQGDGASIEALKQAGERIGIVLAGVINMLNPERVVIGGSVASSESFLIQALTDKAKECSHVAPRGQTTIHQGKLANVPIALGAAIAVIYENLGPPPD